jgi:hypothetical protein
MKKFEESKLVTDYEVLTDDGWVDIHMVHKTVPYMQYTIATAMGKILTAADTHLIFSDDKSVKYVKDLSVGDSILTKDGTEIVVSVKFDETPTNMYDLELPPDSNNRYYTNGILSHNTTSYCIFALHMLCFNVDKSILILANKKDAALEFVSRIKFAYELLPNWLKPGIEVWNKARIEFSNGCKVEGCATSPDSARGKACNVLIIDECLLGDEKITIQSIETGEIREVGIGYIYEDDKYN